MLDIYVRDEIPYWIHIGAQVPKEKVHIVLETLSGGFCFGPEDWHRLVKTLPLNVLFSRMLVQPTSVCSSHHPFHLACTSPTNLSAFLPPSISFSLYLTNQPQCVPPTVHFIQLVPHQPTSVRSSHHWLYSHHQLYMCTLSPFIQAPVVHLIDTVELSYYYLHFILATFMSWTPLASHFLSFPKMRFRLDTICSM